MTLFSNIYYFSGFNGNGLGSGPMNFQVKWTWENLQRYVSIQTLLLWKIPVKNTKTISSLKHELLEGKQDLPGTPVYIVYTNGMWCSFCDKTENKAYFIFGWVKHKTQQTFLFS